MEKLQWEDGLSVGIGLIDEQHKTWIKHFNSVAETLATQQALTQIIKTLNFLVDYTDDHFSNEERYMSESRYPELDAHKARHDELRQTLANLVQEFEEEGATHKLADSVDTLLRNWLIRHIQDVDKRFGAYIKERGIELSA